MSSVRHSVSVTRWLRISLSRSLFLIALLTLTTFSAIAQPNPLTKLDCGEPSVRDTYSATAEENEGDAIAGGPMACSLAKQIVASMNQSNACCEQPFAKALVERAKRTARSRCNDSAGFNFACDIFLDDVNVCIGGCGLTVQPANNPLGCQDTGVPQCTSVARAVEVAPPGEGCMITCAARAVASADGAFDVRCSTCTEQSNCEGLAQAEVDKQRKLQELEAKKAQLERALAALDPRAPNYLAMARDIAMQIASVVAEIHGLLKFFSNLKKLVQLGLAWCRR